MLRGIKKILTAVRGRRFWAMLLSIGIVVSMLPSANALDKQLPVRPKDDDSDRCYILEISTGISDGRNVQFLGIRYRDEKGTEHTEYIYPHEGDLARSYILANEAGKTTDIGDINKRLNAAKQISGYYPVVDFSDTKLQALQAHTTDMFIIQPRYKLVEYLGLDVFMRYNTNVDENDETNRGDGNQPSKGWALAEANLYRVDELGGLAMRGYLSSDYFIRFKGTQLSELDFSEFGSDESVFNLNLDKSDKLFQFGRSMSGGFKEKRDLDIPVDTIQDDEYLLELEFADVNQAGVEALNAEKIDAQILQDPAEAITIKMTYTVENGRPRTAYIPMVTGALGWALEKNLIALDKNNKFRISGVAQQGESLVVGACLPRFTPESKITSFCLLRGQIGTKAARITAVTPQSDGKGTDSARRQDRQKQIESETINIARFDMFRPGTAVERDRHELADGAADAMMTIQVNSDSPIRHYRAYNEGGDALAKDSTDLTNRLSEKNEDEKRDDTGDADHFIVQIKTQEGTNSATTEPVTLKLTYRTNDGQVKSTDGLSLESLAMDFYGYWPGSSGNASYISSMASGATLTCKIDLKNVKQFLSASFSVSTKCEDDWQMESIQIFETGKVSKRLITWNGTAMENKNPDRTITRKFETTDENRVAWYPNLKDQAETPEDELGIFLNNRHPNATIDFGDGSRSIVHERKPVDWSKIRYSMSYEESKQDLGFTFSDTTYEVQVTVASDSKATETDDCGSTNLFYFKLNFEAGNSAYVLANQQLTGDGFRAGRIESFLVETNEDYGELESVSIIPSNEGSANQDLFDKLNIANINVVNRGKGGIDKTWRIGDVGWIDINFADDGSQEHLEGELAKICKVDSVGYSVDLVFTVTTDEYTNGDPQFRGAVSAMLEYYDTNGIRKKYPFDMVSYMYDYSQSTTQYFSKDFTIKGVHAARSDPSAMFRGQHTDRFVLTLPDVRELICLTIMPSGEVRSNWNIGSVAVSQIETKGSLRINKYDEYVRSDKLVEVTHGNSVNGYPIFVPAPLSTKGETFVGAQQSVQVDFVKNAIKVDTSGSKWTSAITHEPSSKNDTLNLFVYIDPTSVTPISDPDFNLRANISYSVRDNDRELSIGTGLMMKDLEQSMFYARGLKAYNLANLRELRLQLASLKNVYAGVTRAVVQQVRSGVVIKTLYYDMRNASIGMNPVCQLDNPSPPSVSYTQKATIFLSQATQSLSLIAGVDDLAVAIRYRSVGANDETSYDSKYVFLSDVMTKDANGDVIPKYPSIGPGMMIEVPFSEAGAVQIVGLTIASMGKVVAGMDAAIVQNSYGDKTDWVSFATALELTQTPRTVAPTKDTVIPVRMSFTNVKPAEILTKDADSGSPAPIRMTVTYTEAESKIIRTYVVDDITKLVSSGSFDMVDQDNREAVITFFMTNVMKIRSIKLEPYSSDPYATATWTISKVSYLANIQGTIHGREVDLGGDKQVKFGEPLQVNFGTILLDLEASYMDDTGVKKKEVTDKDHNLFLNVLSRQKVTIKVSLDGSLDTYGYTVKMQRQKGVVGDEAVWDEPVELFHSVEEGIVLDLPEKYDTTDDVVYRLIFTSEENPDVVATAYITVTPPVEPVDPTDPSDPSEDPSEPTEPTEPTDPTTPSEATEPSEEPTDPSENNDSLRYHGQTQSMNRGEDPRFSFRTEGNL